MPSCPAGTTQADIVCVLRALGQAGADGGAVDGSLVLTSASLRSRKHKHLTQRIKRERTYSNGRLL